MYSSANTQVLALEYMYTINKIINYISEGSVSHMNGVWPVFPLKSARLALIIIFYAHEHVFYHMFPCL